MTKQEISYAIQALKEFQEYGEETYNPHARSKDDVDHTGRFSGQGFAAARLRQTISFLEDLKNGQKTII